jgi:hypothetical protein
MGRLSYVITMGKAFSAMEKGANTTFLVELG